jgi:hypothetical protein
MAGSRDLFNHLFASDMITLDLQTFRQSQEGGNVTGVIYVELGLKAFPERGWSDFPAIVLGWWAEALFQLEVPTRHEVLWRFMDGPHSLTLTKVDGAVSSDALALAQVQSSLLGAAERVVAFCEQHKMFSKDLETLRMNVGQLKANQTVQRTRASRSAHIEIRPSVAAGSCR